MCFPKAAYFRFFLYYLLKIGYFLQFSDRGEWDNLPVKADDTCCFWWVGKHSAWWKKIQSIHLMFDSGLLHVLSMPSTTCSKPTLSVVFSQFLWKPLDSFHAQLRAKISIKGRRCPALQPKPRTKLSHQNANCSWGQTFKYTHHRHECHVDLGLLMISFNCCFSRNDELCAHVWIYFWIFSPHKVKTVHTGSNIYVKGSKMAFSLARSRTISISSMIMIDYSGSFSARIKRFLFDSSHWIDHYSAQWEGPKNLVTI